MKKMLIAALLVAGMSLNLSHAASNTEAISKCLSDSTTGKDRKDLARWIFSVMAQHPEVNSLANIPPKNLAEIEKSVGLLYNRLVTEDCAKPLQAALKANDQTALSTAFENLGRLAMQELMSDPSVTAAFSNIGKYFDREKWSQLMK